MQPTTNQHHTTTVLQPFFREHPGEPVPEENFWTLWCKGWLTEADTTMNVRTITQQVILQCYDIWTNVHQCCTRHCTKSTLCHIPQQIHYGWKVQNCRSCRDGDRNTSTEKSSTLYSMVQKTGTQTAGSRQSSTIQKDSRTLLHGTSPNAERFSEPLHWRSHLNLNM